MSSQTPTTDETQARLTRDIADLIAEWRKTCSIMDIAYTDCQALQFVIDSGVIEQHDRRAKADGWDQGYLACLDDMTAANSELNLPRQDEETPNPHRTRAGDQR